LGSKKRVETQGIRAERERARERVLKREDLGEQEEGRNSRDWS